jgi:hypothetical protein
VIAFTEIVSIEKRMTAKIIPNAIQISTLHSKVSKKHMGQNMYALFLFSIASSISSLYSTFSPLSYLVTKPMINLLTFGMSPTQL